MPARICERHHTNGILAIIIEDPVGRFVHSLRVMATADRLSGTNPSSSLAAAERASDAFIAREFPSHRCTDACGEWRQIYPN
jgi:hypothetical protein